MSDAELLRALREHGPDATREDTLIGGWLATKAELPTEPGPLAVAPGREPVFLRDGTLNGAVAHVPRARDATRIAMLAEGGVYVVDRAACQVVEGENLAGEPRDTVVLDGTPAAGGAEGLTGVLRVRGALVRVALMTGALERIAALTLRHAEERRQFGRPIGAFQAVQEHLVTVAQQAALAGVAADAAIDGGGRPVAVAMAKVLCGRAARTATRAAHQVHGAVGMTRAHPLALETRRLWAWRSEYGTEREWAAGIGRAAVRGGADGLYRVVTGEA